MDGPDEKQAEERRKERENWIRIHLDNILDQRLTVAMEGPMAAAELRYTAELARSDALLSVRYHCLMGSKPSEIRAIVQAFQALDEWVAAKGPGSSAVKAARVSSADISRVQAMIKKARGDGA